MPYICKDCKNKKLFRREAYGRCDYTETQEINEDGDVHDTVDMDYDDFEEDGVENFTCAECGSENIAMMTDNEWEEWNGPAPKEKVEDETWQEFVNRQVD